jgi:hypothetical protein
VNATSPDGSEQSERIAPANYHHCREIYQEMESQATRQGDMIVYEGHLTHLIRNKNYSTPYYAKLTQGLKRMGCIRQLRRGGGNAISQWQLIQEPTEDLWFSTADKKLPAGGKTGQRLDAVEQTIRDFNRRLQELEASNG